MTGTTPPPLGSRPLSQVRTEVVVGRPAAADDIVTRLRNLAADGLGGCCADMSDAADEIERLRDQRDAERTLADQLAHALVSGSFRGSTTMRRDRMYGSGWEAVHDALDAWEARRG